MQSSKLRIAVESDVETAPVEQPSFRLHEENKSETVRLITLEIFMYSINTHYLASFICMLITTPI